MIFKENLVYNVDHSTIGTSRIRQMIGDVMKNEWVGKLIYSVIDIRFNHVC